MPPGTMGWPHSVFQRRSRSWHDHLQCQLNWVQGQGLFLLRQYPHHAVESWLHIRSPSACELGPMSYPCRLLFDRAQWPDLQTLGETCSTQAIYLVSEYQPGCNTLMHSSDPARWPLPTTDELW